MINIKQFVFNDFQENTYVLYDESGECVIIDAGNYGSEENELLAGFIENNNLKPVRLLNTHCHIDHITGNLFISEKYSLLPEAHTEEITLVKNAAGYAGVFGFDIQKPPEISKYLNDGETIRFGKSELSVLYVPGHSRGSLAFYSAENNLVITGDVLFYESIGRTDLPGGNFNDLMLSIKEKLFTLPPETTVYPGHGPETTIAHEISYNPFII